MAGQKVTMTVTEPTDKWAGGLPLAIIEEDVQPDDEWGLFRLTNDGLGMYNEGFELAASIMSMYIGKKRAVVEISRHKTREEAKEAWDELSKKEQERTLIRAVSPK